MSKLSVASWVCACVTGTVAAVMPVAGSSYPIDCAILLCLAGGFPTSSECAAAKAEMIRRITPWPIEPPLQLWLCPTGGGGTVSSVGPDKLTPEIRQFRDGVEIYDINYRQWPGRDEMHIIDRSRVGAYSGTGSFFWAKQSMQSAPAWVFQVTGRSSYQIRHQTGAVLRWRGVLLRWRDHQGQYAHEWVPY